MRFLDLFLELSRRDVLQRPRPGRGKPYKKEALAFLEQVKKHNLHLENTLTKDELCSLTNLSSIQLHNMFKRNFDTTYSQFMNRCRVEEAKQLLADSASGEIGMDEIASASGFGSRSAFNLCFKKTVKLSPTEFRMFHRHFKEKTGICLIEYRYKNSGLNPPSKESGD